MGWSVVGVARIEQTWGQWRALVTCSLDSPPTTQSFWLDGFATQPANADALASANTLVSTLNSQGASDELSSLVDNDTMRTLVYQTGAQLAALFRSRFKTSSKQDCAKMANWLLNRITDGTFTDAQVQNAFGLTTTQYNNLKSQMQTLQTHWQAVLASTGS